LAHILPPAANAGAEDWRFYCSQKLLRFLLGEEGYASWGAALQVFFKGILAAVIRVYGDETAGQDAADRLGEIKDTFPLVLEEI
jgi:hypothetical protein